MSDHRDYEVLRTRFGATLTLGDLTLDADAPRLDRGQVRATLSVVNGSLLYRSTTNLTSETARRKVVARVAAKGTDLAEDLLLALEEGCRQRPPTAPGPPPPPPPAATEPGSAVLAAVEAYLARFVAYPSASTRIAHALWIVHAHLMAAWTSTPRIAFLSPEPASGKTRALEVTEPLVPNPVEAINVTPAYLFRKVGSPAGLPTILFDEVDTVFGPKAKEHEEVRGLLNAGHRRGAVAGRCVVRGEVVETEEIPAFCAVALAGLGDIPDTLLSRAVVVRMRRRSAAERVHPFRRRVEEANAHTLRDRIAAWAASVEAAVADAWPAMPAGVVDRDADIWESLLAVADAAGGDWPERARAAATALVAESKASTPSLGVRLLEDLQTVFALWDQLSTETILRSLNEMEEAPWSEIAAGKPLNARGLAARLGQYGITSTTLRQGEATFKGYKREALTDAWARYLRPARESEEVPV